MTWRAASWPCTARVLDPESDAGPSSGGVVDHVALGRRVASDDQADQAGQERQRSLAGRVEQALGRQQLAALLDPGQQLADADRADLLRLQRQRAARHVVLELRLDDDPRALGDRGRHRVEDRPRARDLHRHLGERVAQA